MIPPFVASFGAKLIKNSGKYILLGIGAYFLYGELRTVIGNYKQEQKDIGAYELADVVHQATLAKKDAEITALQLQLAVQQAADARNKAKIVEVQDENEEFRIRIQRHDIDAIIASRGSEVVERAYTRGTNAYFKLWNDKTRELEHYSINRANDLSPLLEIRPATGNPERPSN
jgi:hypothetical protein